MLLLWRVAPHTIICSEVNDNTLKAFILACVRLQPSFQDVLHEAALRARSERAMIEIVSDQQLQNALPYAALGTPLCRPLNDISQAVARAPRPNDQNTFVLKKFQPRRYSIGSVSEVVLRADMGCEEIFG